MLHSTSANIFESSWESTFGINNQLCEEDMDVIMAFNVMK